MKCLFCGETEESKMMNKGGGRKCPTLCKRCHSKNVVRRGRRNKRLFVEYKGGKCEQCGYNKCLSALEFHHLDPTQKDPTFQSMRYWSVDRARAELDKCLLVCSNCHREIHESVIDEDCGAIA